MENWQRSRQIVKKGVCTKLQKEILMGGGNVVGMVGTEQVNVRSLRKKTKQNRNLQNLVC